MIENIFMKYHLNRNPTKLLDFLEKRKRNQIYLFDKVGTKTIYVLFTVIPWKDLHKSHLLESLLLSSLTDGLIDWQISTLSVVWTPTGFLFYSLMFQINPINLLIHQLKTVISNIRMHSIYIQVRPPESHGVFSEGYSEWWVW